MFSILHGLRLSQHPMLRFQHLQGDEPVSSFRRSVSSSVRSSGKGGSEEVFESRTEETNGCGLKRIVVERGLGHKAMKLTQVSDGAGGTTEERVFTNVSKEEESLFDDSNWLQTKAGSKLPAISVQTPVKALPASSTPQASQNVVTGSTLKAADAPTPADPEVDEHGVPISGSVAATEDGSFQATASASNSTPEMQPQDQQDGEQQAQQEQQQQEQKQGQQKRHCSTHRRHRSNVDIDPFLQQILSVQRMSRAFDPFYSWPFERPLLPRAHRCYDFVPVRDPFDLVMFNRPMLDVWG